MTLKDKKILTIVKHKMPAAWKRNKQLMRTIKEFIAYRSEKRRPLTSQGVDKLLVILKPHSNRIVIASLNEAMVNSWNLPYPDKLSYLDFDDVHDESMSSIIRILEKRFSSGTVHIDGYSALEFPGRRFYEREVKRVMDKGAFGFTDKRKVATVMFDFLEALAGPARSKGSGIYAASDLFGVYVAWMLYTADWISLSEMDPMAVFKSNSKIFRKFLSYESRFNNNVNPLTGERFG